jgi:hypothetical protein
MASMTRSLLTDLMPDLLPLLLLALAIGGILWVTIQTRKSTWISDAVTKRLGLVGCLTLMGTFIAGALVGGCVSGFLTVVAIQGSSHDRRYEYERDAVAPVIAKDPAFKDVHVSEDSDPTGGAYISGYVPTTADKKRLKDLVIRALGERHGEYLMRPVHARDERK